MKESALNKHTSERMALQTSSPHRELPVLKVIHEISRKHWSFHSGIIGCLKNSVKEMCPVISNN